MAVTKGESLMCDFRILLKRGHHKVEKLKSWGLHCSRRLGVAERNQGKKEQGRAILNAQNTRQVARPGLELDNCAVVCTRVRCGRRSRGRDKKTANGTQNIVDGQK